MSRLIFVCQQDKTKEREGNGNKKGNILNKMKYFFRIGKKQWEDRKLKRIKIKD